MTLMPGLGLCVPITPQTPGFISSDHPATPTDTSPVRWAVFGDNLEGDLLI